MATTTTTPVIETIVANIKTISLFEDEKVSNVRVTVDKTFTGFVLNDGVPTESEVDYFGMSRSNLTRQLCNVNEDIALYRACLTHSFTQKDLAILLTGSKIKFNREFHAAGELLEGSDNPLERDCYITALVSVELSARAVKALDKVLDL